MKRNSSLPAFDVRSNNGSNSARYQEERKTPSNHHRKGTEFDQPTPSMGLPPIQQKNLPHGTPKPPSGLPPLGQKHLNRMNGLPSGRPNPH